MSAIKFSKMAATGNDFVVINSLSSKPLALSSKIAIKICDRKNGIGADGVLLLEKSRKADFKMRIFNPDGSEAEMCGNGSRCIALYAKLNKIAGSNMAIETQAGILSAKVSSCLVKINMTEPEDLKLNINLSLDSKNYQLYYINTGVPHAISHVSDIDAIDVCKIGRAIRYHKLFSPKGTNVDFLMPLGKSSISIRTYERGVEGETLACGTGATASAIISSIVSGFKSPVKIYARGGELKIYFKRNKNRFTDVYLEGEAHEVFRGEIRRLAC